MDKGTEQSSEESEDTDREIAVEKVIRYKSEKRLTRHTIANSAFAFAMAQCEQAKILVGLQLCWPSFVYD